MKTYVILDNIFSADLIKDFFYVQDNLNMKKYNFISPLTFLENNGKFEQENFTIHLMGGAISIGNMYNEFKTIESIVDKNKITIYFGMAHTNVKADKVLVVNKVALDTQEALLDSYIKEAGVRFNYIKSSEADENFNTIEEAVTFLNGL
jgi:hypothetical protein